MVLEQFIIDADIIWDQVGKTFFENPEAKAGRIMRVQVVNAGIVEDLTGYTLNLGWTSVRDPSKFGLDAFDDVDITKGIFEIEYTSGMLTNIGPLNASLQLVPPGEGRPIESNNFKLTVKNSAINPEAIQGETSFSTLENALVEVNGWNARIDDVEQDFIDRANNLDETYPTRLLSVETSLGQKADLADLPSSAYTFKGSTTFALLPTTLNTLGDVYYVTDGTPQNYAWTGTAWTPIGNGAFGNGSVTTQKIAINAVTPTTTNFAVEDGIPQIFDATNLVIGRYYNGGTPTSTTATDTTYATVALNLTPGETYAFTGLNEPFSRVYNGTTLKLVNTLPDFIVYNNDAYSGLASDKIRQFTVPLDATMLYLTFRILSTMLPPMIFKTSSAIHPTEAVPYLSLIKRTLIIPDLAEPIAEQALVIGQQALDATIALGATPQNVIHVKKDGTGDFTSFVSAILSITDSSALNPYDVYVYDDHDILGELGGQAFAESLTSDSDRESIFIPAYVNIYSGVHGKITLSMELLPVWKVDYNTIKALSTIEVKEGHNIFRNITVTAKNVRYPVHDESNGGFPNTTVTWEDCEIIHYGNADFVGDPVGQWVSSCGYGSGMSSGNKLFFKNCKFYSYSFYPFSVHDNANFAIGVYIHFEDCEFINGGGNPTYYQDIKLSTYLTGSVENVAVVNNSLLSSVLIRNEVTGQTPNRWRLKGGGNYTAIMSSAGVAVPVTITI